MRENCMYKDICVNECSQSCIRFLETDYLLENSYIPKNKRKVNKLIPEKVDVKAFEQLAEIRNDIETFVKNGECLYIYSRNCGNGKTTWSIKMLLQFFNKIWAGNGFKPRGMFLNVPNYLTMCKEFNDKQTMDEVSKIRKKISELDLVVFDDLGIGQLTSADKNNLLDVIEFRLNSHKSTVFTSNLDYNQLIDLFGDRLASRIYHSSTIIELRGSDRRGVK